MCGIWGYIGNNANPQNLFNAYNNIRPRGPERSEYFQWKEFVNFYLGFHRLAIMENHLVGDQPFVHETETQRIVMSCNGEIYNYKELIEDHELRLKSFSDCEVILWLFVKYGIDKTVKLLNGEFAFYIISIDKTKNEAKLYLARDQCGIRPLFYGSNDNTFAFSSESKGLVSNVAKNPQTLVDNIKQFPPRNYMEMDITEKDGQAVFTSKFTEYISFQGIPITIKDEAEAHLQIRQVFTKAVHDRIKTARPMGALLSGGLDSSLVASLLARELKTQGRKLRTFSIGMPGATDRKYAEMVAEKIGSDHTHVEFSEQDFLDAVEEVVGVTETFDITTIRATTGNYLIGKWVSQNTDIKVLLIGDGSDELCSGYMYFFNAPNPVESHKENIRLIEDIHMYDVLRADRGVADNGVEARVPFLDKHFIKLILSIDPELRVPRMCDAGIPMEKALLRDSFKDEDLLPYEVLYRRKEAFSDGVSGLKRSWYVILQEWCDKNYSDQEYEEYKKKTHLPPTSKEALHFRKLFEKFYGKGDIENIVPYFWLPLWSGNITDPSARVLDVYKNDDEEEKKDQ